MKGEAATFQRARVSSQVLGAGRGVDREQVTGNRSEKKATANPSGDGFKVNSHGRQPMGRKRPHKPSPNPEGVQSVN